MMNLFAVLFTFLLLLPSALAQPIVDYRAWQSPVKDQAERGTCTAFAVAAMLETRPGFPTDISEQHLYAWAKMDHYLTMPKTYDEGGFLHFYPEMLQKRGAVPEFKFPYDPQSSVWKEGDDHRKKLEQDLKVSFFDLFSMERYAYKAMASYEGEAKAQDVAYIKNMLDRGQRAIAICYFVNGTYWSGHKGNAQEKLSPWDFLLVRREGKVLSDFERSLSFSNWIDQAKKGQVDLILKHPDLDIEAGHAVCIVGYDNDGFLIKNSWGTSWGDQGYGWVSFDYHQLFAREILFLSDNEVSGWKSKPDIRYASSDFEIKSLPHVYTDFSTKKKTNCISLSVVYTGSEAPPRFSTIVYQIYDGEGKLIDTRYGNTQGVYDGFLSGYETYANCVAHPFNRSITKLAVEFTLTNGQKFMQIYESISPLNRQYRAVK